MPYREDLEAERARADALEERAEELSRENAALHAKLDAPTPPPTQAPQTPPTQSPRKQFAFPSISRLWIVAAFVAFLGAILATGATSGMMKLAAPIVCPKGYAHAVVVLHERGTAKGGTSYTGELWCVFSERHRFPENADMFAVLGVLFGENLLVTMSLATIVQLLRKRKTV